MVDRSDDTIPGTMDSTDAQERRLQISHTRATSSLERLTLGEARLRTAQERILTGQDRSIELQERMAALRSVDDGAKT